MTENFSQLLNQSLEKINIKPGSLVKGLVVSIDKDYVLIDAGLKSESNIPIEQFKNTKGDIEIKVGQEIDLILDTVEDGFGETLLSREKAKKHESWLILENTYKKSKTITGIINGKVKGGFTVEINGIKAFLPGSLVDIRPIHETIHLEGKELEFKVIKIDKKRNNVVVSRKAVMASENNNEKENLLKNIKEDIKIKGIVKNLTDYGAFIDLGGMDGLLHITDMAWKRVKHPSEIVSIGEEIFVKILKFDKEKSRVSLGLKQLTTDPWMSIKERYPEGTKVKGKITNLTDYGCFVEIKEGVEGLVHISEMDWTNKNVNSSKMVNLNEIVEVMILNIDEERRRISLGLKQCQPNPWKKFSENYKNGDQVQGKIKSVTDFGIFVELENGIDGLVHLSDVSWDKNIESIKKYKKGEKIITCVLQVDFERERISLGIKQLKEDPFIKYTSLHKKGSMVIGKITQINQKNISIKLEENIQGKAKIPDSLMNDHKNKKIDQYFNVNDKIQAKYKGIDKKNRIVILSIKNAIEKKINNIKEKKENKNVKNNIMAEAFKAAKNE